MTNLRIPRRDFLAGAAGAATAGAATVLGSGHAVAQNVAPAEAPAINNQGLEAVILGTKGGPRVGGSRSNPGYAFLVDGVPFVVDCGPGVPQQLARAKIPLQDIRHILITHQHSDHNIEYGNTFYLAWSTGLKEKVRTFGPPPLRRMTELFFELNEYDIGIRIADEGKPDLRTLVEPTEITEPGVVYEDGKVRITAALVNHPPVVPSFAFRFDTQDRSIVFSGDTTADDRLIALARDADVLIHEVLYVPGIERLLARVPNAATLRDHLIASHTPTYDLGRVAKEARVKKLILTHFVPGDDPTITDEMWTEDVRKDFAGEIVVGQDLMAV
jgi:ribonuclease BN (tRNA processing enzyme)